jgi:hypothetical protein
MGKLFAVAAIAAMLVDCAPKSIESTAGLQGKRVAVTSHPTRDFSAGVSGNAVSPWREERGQVCLLGGLHTVIESDPVFLPRFWNQRLWSWL